MHISCVTIFLRRRPRVCVWDVVQYTKIRKTNIVWYGMYSHKCLVTKYKYILMMEKLIENNYYSINNNIYDCTPSRKNRSKRCEKEKP